MDSVAKVKATGSRQWQALEAGVVAALLLFASFAITWGASPYTPKQLEALGRYVGKTYWVAGEENKAPALQSAPSPTAPSFRPAAKESFEITEIVGGTPQIPLYYYKVTFASGKEGFIPIGSFIEEYNGAFVSVDPDRDAKAKLAKETEAEKKRQARIKAQPWPEHVKEAALKKQPVLGMSTKEATAVLGKPKSVVAMKTTTLLLGKQEQWIYENGPVLTFTNGLLTSIQPANAPSQ